MKTEAIVLRAHGGPEVLVRETIDLPDPGPREVRVRVRAVALNHLDLWVRRGLPNLKLEYPHRLGADVVGRSRGARPRRARRRRSALASSSAPASRAASASGASRGRTTCAGKYAILGEHTHGGYARHLVVPDANLLPYPGDLPFTQVGRGAARLPDGVADGRRQGRACGRGRRCSCRPRAAACRARPSRSPSCTARACIATAGSDAKAERARALGADEVINYKTHDFVAEVKRLTGKRGVDVVIEHVGGDVMTKSVLATTSGGRIVTCGATAGFEPKIDLAARLLPADRDPRLDDGARRAPSSRILEHVKAGKLRPVVDRVLPLWQAADAHRALEARDAFGKIVLEVE